MGGQPNGTPQGGNNPQLAALFQNQGGYQQNPIPRITAPQLPGQLNPTPEQAQAATLARLQARLGLHPAILAPGTPTPGATPTPQTPAGPYISNRPGRDR